MSTDNELLPQYLCDSGVTCYYAAKISELESQIAQLKSLVRTDALTGLYNYRFFSEALPLEMERVRRNAQPLSLILLDIDHFKHFNDAWGHEAGNKALMHIANVITGALRKLDLPCRYGGEEFGLILPNTGLTRAVKVAERVRLAIAQSDFSIDGTALSLTASLGVGTFCVDASQNVDEFIGFVDSYLYNAKETGRNQVRHPALGNDPEISTQVTDDEKSMLFVHPDASQIPRGNS